MKLKKNIQKECREIVRKYNYAKFIGYHRHTPVHSFPVIQNNLRSLYCNFE